MIDYNNKIIKSGLQIVAKGTYSKTYKSGAPMKFGKYLMPPEGILVFNKSGNDVALPSAENMLAKMQRVAARILEIVFMQNFDFGFFRVD